MKPADNLMFATVDIPILDKKQAAKEILNLDESLSFWDNYRSTKMFPLMTKGGGYGGPGAVKNYLEGDFVWVPYAPKIIVDWFENVVFPWTGSKARIMALLTKPGEENYEHIDCDRNELNSMQHKFRIVLQGKTSISTMIWLLSAGAGAFTFFIFILKTFKVI